MERSLEQKKKYETYEEKYICRDNANWVWWYKINV